LSRRVSEETEPGERYGRRRISRSD
jgi:hypothetical protein